MENHRIADVLDRVADLLEVKRANPYRVRAYRNAARTVESHAEAMAALVARGGDLRALPGIGKDLAACIVELVSTGGLGLCRELEAEVPPLALEAMRLPGIGPARARQLVEQLGVADLAGLEAACRDGRVAALPGFGERTAARLLETLQRRQAEGVPRLRLDQARRLVEPLVAYLAEGGVRVEAAGSYRRRLETVGDLDLVAAADEPHRLIERLLAWPSVVEVKGAGDTRASVALRGGVQVDLRAVAPASFGAALLYLTGSKRHNVRLRARALERGERLSEYGLFREADGARLAGVEETDVYRALGLDFVPPELREDRGEIEAAAAGALPRLLEPGELRGDLQMHTTWSDGRQGIERMVEACAARGYEYLAITDHSAALPMIRGLSPERVLEQWREMDEIAARHPEIRLLRGLEVDILADGALDLPDDLLARLDLVVVAVHSRFNLPAGEQTERVLKAVRHPAVHVLAHPTGRLIGQRRPLELDLEAVLAACAAHRVAVELNAQADRLDLCDVHLGRARELGIPVAISSDAHSPAALATISLGVEQARRAWLEPRHVLNARPLVELSSWLADKRLKS